jgi:aminotransferase
MRMDEMLSKRAAMSEPGEKQKMIDLASKIDDVISLGRGDPDLKTPDLIIDSAISAMRDPKPMGYTKWPGMPELRKLIAGKYTEDRGVKVDPSQVMVTVGAQEAVFMTMMTFIDQGDEVIMFEPRYTPYDLAVNLVGGKIVSVPTTGENDFLPTVKEIECHITDKTKAILIISPSNPTGSVFPMETLAEIAEIAKKHNLLVISDELYSDLVYDGEFAPSIAAIPGMAERTVIINGFSKSFSMTGWRVGYLIASDYAVRLMTEMKSAVTICAPYISQQAAVTALKEGETETDEIVAVYDERRRLVMSRLDSLGIAYNQPKGTFYLFADVRSVLDKGETAFSFTQSLLEQKKVLVFPGTIFGQSGEGFIRISLLQPLSKIKEAMDLFESFMRERKG